MICVAGTLRHSLLFMPMRECERTLPSTYSERQKLKLTPTPWGDTKIFLCQHKKPSVSIFLLNLRSSSTLLTKHYI